MELHKAAGSGEENEEVKRFMKNDNFIDELQKNIKKYSSRCIGLALDLAENPEISGMEYASSEKICRLLEEYGFTAQLPLDEQIPTSFRATSKEKEGRRNVCLLAEYDALPEIGHGCGHNVSCAISILSALALKEMQEDLDINVIVMGTPREESDGAKGIMADKGYFDDMDMAIMIHMYDENFADPALYAMKLFEYRFSGKSAHSATAPWEGKNALNGVMLMLHAADMLRQHVRPDTRIHWVIREGGKAPNMVPDMASCEIYIRSLDWTYLEELTCLIDDCAKGAAIATQTKTERIAAGPPNYNIKPNAAGTKVIKKVYEKLGLPVHDSRERVFGSSDVGNVSLVCPTFQPTLELAPYGTALHTSEFAYAAGDEKKVSKAVETGAEIIARTIIEIFSDEEIFREMKADFGSR